MISKILVAIDGSSASNRAVALAIDLAMKYDASIHFLNVIRDMQVPPQLMKMAKVEKIGQGRVDVLEFVANQILGDAEQRAKNSGAKKIQKTIEHGDPATAIIKRAKRHNIDLIVLGTRGLGKIKGALLGSVSRKVANICDVNCVIVR
ncbi:MAG TPA: universal stress protein [Gammaproteobacteria bacterium]|nr:universal stress protein [Gammaproteobacteria bacterium]